MINVRNVGMKCRRGQPGAPENLGPWYENDEGRRKTYGDWGPLFAKYAREHDSTSEGMPMVLLPNLYAIKSGEPNNSKTRRFIAGKCDVPHIPDHEGQRSADTIVLLEKLPTEILVEVLLHFILTGRIFHITPTTCKRAGRQSFSIHQICHPDNQDPNFDISSLGLTCQLLKDVSYGLLYGRNQFVLELATMPLVSEVQLEYASMIKGRTIADALSWGRVCTPEISRTPDVFYPLTAGTMRYVSDLTVTLNLSSSNSRTDERRELARQVQTLVACFDERSSLKRLAVGFAVSAKKYGNFVSEQLEHRRYSAGRKRMVLRDEIPAERSKVTARRVAIHDAVVEPLLQLRGVKELMVRGLASGQFEKRLRDSVLREWAEEHEPSGKRAKLE